MYYEKNKQKTNLHDLEIDFLILTNSSISHRLILFYSERLLRYFFFNRQTERPSEARTLNCKVVKEP